MVPRLIVRSVDRNIGRRSSRLIVYRSLIATTSRTISCDDSCPRYSPIVRDSVTTRRDRSRYATAAGDRSKHCRSLAPWHNRNQLYYPEIVRSGVTVALSPAYILTISPRFTVAAPVFTQHLRRRLLIRRIVFLRRCVNTGAPTVNRGEIVSMYAGL